MNKVKMIFSILTLTLLAVKLEGMSLDSYFNTNKNLIEEKPLEFVTLIEAIEGLIRTQGVQSDLKDVINYFNGLGFNSSELINSLQGSVEDKITALKQLKKRVPRR